MFTHLAAVEKDELLGAECKVKKYVEVSISSEGLMIL
jgi:hypothetical protein